MCIEATPRHGPVRPMAHVARPSREQDLMHATRVCCSSPDGSPSFRLPIYHQAAGDLAVHKGRLRDGQSLKQPGDWTLQTLGTFFCAARVSPGTRDMPLAIHSAGNIALDVGCSPSQTLASAPG